MKKSRSILLIAAVVIAVFLGSGSFESARAAVKPEIVLTSYSLGDELVYEEETFIDVTFQNMNEEFACSAILISYTSSNQSIVPSFGHSNQIFINKLNAGQAKTIQIPIVIHDRGDGYASMNFNIEYTVEDTAVFNSSCYIMFPIGDTAEASVNIRNVNVTTETTIGANSLVSVSFENLLKTELGDAKLIISGDVNDGEIFSRIGTVAAKATKYAEYYLSFSSEGQKMIKLQLGYTLDTGEEVIEDVGEYMISVKQGISQGTSDISLSEAEMANNQKQSYSMSLSTIFFILGGVVLLIGVIVFLITWIKKKNS